MRFCLWPVPRSGLALTASFPLLVGFFGICLLGAPRAVNAQQMEMMPPSQAELIRGLLPTVVNITSYVGAVAAPSMNAASGSATSEPGHPRSVKGSGFIIDPSGVILTNYHVIDGAYDVEVMFSDGMRVPGHILATAERVDLALVKVEPQKPLIAIHWADSDKVQIGDTVFAIGNPLGIGLSVTSGIVSALNRNLMDSPYDDFIQTDAAINHGNSGGPLFNRAGEVIGVDTAIISPTSGSAGLGFAIPANDAKFVATRLMRDGELRPAYLGLKIEEVTDEMASALDMKQAAGAIVALVHKDGPAAKAGLQVGDVILTYANQTPRDERALLRDIAKSTIGETVPATILRAGHEQTIHFTPIAWPAMPGTPGSTAQRVARPAMLVPPNLGLSLSGLTGDLRARYALQMQQAGVLVDGVASGTDAFDHGLMPGDVILRVQNQDVATPEQVQAAVDAARAQHKVFILVLVQPKTTEQNPGPRWMALRVSA
jgi:serine protease Do